jgi:hypothetical protein
VGHGNGNIGQTPRVANYLGTLQLFYYDQTNGNLRHAWSNSTGWHFENLDGDPGAVGRYNSDLGRWPVVMDYNSTLQLFYYDQGQGNLRHAWSNSTGWHFENLDGDSGSVSQRNGNVGLMPAMTQGANGRLYVFYYDQAGGNLRSAAAGTSGWQFANVDGDNGALATWNSDTGLDATATVFNGTVQLFYSDAGNGALRHGFATP